MVQLDLTYACVGLSCAGHSFCLWLVTSKIGKHICFSSIKRDISIKWFDIWDFYRIPKYFSLFVLLQRGHLTPLNDESSKPCTLLHTKSKFSNMNPLEYLSIIVHCTIHHPLDLSGDDPACCTESSSSKIIFYRFLLLTLHCQVKQVNFIHLSLTIGGTCYTIKRIVYKIWTNKNKVREKHIFHFYVQYFLNCYWC